MNRRIWSDIARWSLQHPRRNRRAAILGVFAPAVSISFFVLLLGIMGGGTVSLDDVVSETGGDLVRVAVRQGAQLSSEEVAERAGMHDLVVAATPIRTVDSTEIRANQRSQPLALKGITGVIGSDESVRTVLGNEALALGRWPAWPNGLGLPTALIGADVAAVIPVRVGESAILVDDVMLPVVGVLAPVPNLPEFDRAVVVDSGWLASQALNLSTGQGSVDGWVESGSVTSTIIEGALVVARQGQASIVAEELPYLVGMGRPAPLDVGVSGELARVRTGIADETRRLLTAVAIVSVVAGSALSFISQKRSLTARTSEIGLYMSLGASSTMVALAFFLESVLLTLVIMMIGVPVGLLAGMAASLVGLTVEWSTAGLVYGVTFVCYVLLLSGIVPTISTTRIDPVRALG